MKEKSDIIARLRGYLQENRITRSQIAKDLGMWQPTVNSYFTEGTASSRQMPITFLEEIVEMFPEIDAEWLLRGKSQPQMSITGDNNNGNGTNNSVTINSTEELNSLRNEVKRLRDQNASLTKSNETLIRLLAEAKTQG